MLHVMKGQRNLTKPVVMKVARAIGLNEAETEYFENLVFFNQAKSQSDKTFYFSKILNKRKNARVKSLNDAQYEFFNTWYHSVVRELIMLISPNADAAKLAKLLVPPVGTIQVRKSLKLMLDLGLIKKNKEGNYEQCEAFIAAGGPVRNLAIVNFQKAMLALAAQAWDFFPENEIHMNTVTVAISEDLVEPIAQEIAVFKKNVLSMVANDKKPAIRAYHINVNFFPVSKKVKETGT